jgi:hypothetical protein
MSPTPVVMEYTPEYVESKLVFDDSLADQGFTFDTNPEPDETTNLSPAAEYIMDQWRTDGSPSNYGSGVSEQVGDYLTSTGLTEIEIEDAREQASTERDRLGHIEGYTEAGIADLSVGPTSVYDDPRETRFSGIDKPGIPYEPILSGQWQINDSGIQSVTQAELTLEDQVKIQEIIDHHRASQASEGRTSTEIPTWQVQAGSETGGVHSSDSYIYANADILDVELNEAGYETVKTEKSNQQISFKHLTHDMLTEEIKEDIESIVKAQTSIPFQFNKKIQGIETPLKIDLTSPLSV